MIFLFFLDERLAYQFLLQIILSITNYTSSEDCLAQSLKALTLQCCIEQLVQIVHTALVCEKSTFQMVLMALKLISHNPNSSHGSGF